MNRGTIHCENEILAVLQGLKRRYRKKYCKPSQRKLLELLRRLYGVRMSRRTLNRKLRKLEDAGWIYRIRRHRRREDGKMEMRTTVYYVHRKARFRGERLAKTARQIIGYPVVKHHTYNYEDRKEGGQYETRDEVRKGTYTENPYRETVH